MQERTIVTTSWDDGHRLDNKMAELLMKYGIRGTFYVAPNNREISPADRLSAEGVRRLARDFEIGAHTMTHPRLTKLSAESARQEIVESKKILEDMTGRMVRSFCYPAGYYNNVTKALVKDAGFALARTVVRGKTFIGRDPYAMPTSAHAFQHLSDLWHPWHENAIELFNKAEKEGGVFHLWGHSWEVEERNEWDKVERVLAHLAGRPHVSYLTNGELV